MEKVLSVSEILSLVSDTLGNYFKIIHIEGEIKGITCSTSKHWYFSITDSQSSLPCVLFHSGALKNPLIKTLKDGDKVILSGELNIYKARGNLQLMVHSIVKTGKGNFFVEFEKLKEKLLMEGLFDDGHKQQIPSMCKNIAMITSEKGAALADFINIFKRRSIFMNLTLIPALVQGEEAPQSLIGAFDKIKYLIGNEQLIFDVVVIMRGGGSVEDLWAFNSEELARTIYHFPLPVISAVGHQSDFTICDFVADKRTETPSAAAELLTQGQTELINKMSQLKTRILKNLESFTYYHVNRLENKNPMKQLGYLWDLFDRCKKRLHRYQKMERFFDVYGLSEKFIRLDELYLKMSEKISVDVIKKSTHLDSLHASLRSLNPNNVLKRGFTIIRGGDNQLITRKKLLESRKKDELLTISFYDGDVCLNRNKHD